MYTVYLILVIVIIMSFVTGNILLIYNHKSQKEKTIVNNVLEVKEAEPKKTYYEEPVIIRTFTID